MLFPAGFDAQHHRQHLLAETDAIDQQRHQIEITQFLLAELFQPRRAGSPPPFSGVGLRSPPGIASVILINCLSEDVWTATPLTTNQATT